jgi:SAM-dependent methyltransferase
VANGNNMVSSLGWYTPAQARQEMAAARDMFNRLVADGRLGQREEQGGNYYLDDPVESRNFEAFRRRLDATANATGNRRVLVAACGDGLEIELLQGFDVTGFDFAPNMVETTRRRLKDIGASATLLVDDVVDLDPGKYPQRFAGVMFAQSAAFIPPVGPDDSFLRRAVANLAALVAEGGVFYFSTTLYDDPRHQRPWELYGWVVGVVTYFARPLEAIAAMLTDAGIDIVHCEHFDSRTVYPGETYMNDYIIGVRPH